MIQSILLEVYDSSILQIFVLIFSFTLCLFFVLLLLPPVSTDSAGKKCVVLQNLGQMLATKHKYL